MIRLIVSNYSLLSLFIIVAFCYSCASSSTDDYWGEYEDINYSYSQSSSSDNIDNGTTCIKVAYEEMDGGTITVPVKINGMSLDMIFDTGASSTCITLAEANYLYEKGKLNDNDILDTQQFMTADGNLFEGLRVLLRKVQIGDEIMLHDVEAVVVQNQMAPLLLGQTVLKQFREVSVDRENGVVKFYK
ncbi:MAG: retroviral-like aspartic protease family protein [Clostridia bacterium]|nr:retroviral-like aspartic protease family protein [Bacteroidales bacterium]MBR3919818.1 retroviral-like aspartic protease family protein [Clostridia bacterium]